MLGLIFGGLLAGFLGLIFGFLIMWLIDEFTRHDGTAALVACIVVCAIGGSLMGVSLEKHGNLAFEAKFTAQKQAIEESISNKTLSGFERVELVKQSSELNASLAEQKYNCQQWYGFTIPDSVLELEPVSLNKPVE